MVGSRLNVHLYRDSFNTPWGFRLQGGKDLNQPLIVQRVFSNSPAEGELQRGDVILSINSRDAGQLTHKQAQDLIKHGGGQVQLVVNRPPPGTHVAPLSPPIVTQQPRAPSLQYVQKIQQAWDEEATPATHTFIKNRLDRLKYVADVRYQPSPTRPTQMSMYYTAPTDQRPPQYPGGQMQVTSYPDRTRGFSQPPTTPTTPTPPWAAQQAAPKRVSKLSRLGGGGSGFSFGTDYATLPRSSAAKYGTGRSAPKEADYQDGSSENVEPERLATGPVPKVCNRRNLGGGGYSFGADFSTLPRRTQDRRLSQPVMPGAGKYGHMPTKVTLNRLGGGGPEFGSDYRFGSTPAQRVQTTLDNIALSPRTPEVQQSSPFYQQYQPAPQQPQMPPPEQMYTPTGLLLEQQRLQQQQQEQEYEGEGAIVPVWERRKQFQAREAGVRTPANRPPPKVLKPQPGPSTYTDFGTDYSRQPPKQSVAQWRPAQAAPAPQFKPAPAPVNVPVVQYSPIKQSQPPAPAPRPVKIENADRPAAPEWHPPSYDGDEGVPAWRSSLRPSSGVKPWEKELSYAQEQQPVRSVPYTPPQMQAPAPTTFSPTKTPVMQVGGAADEEQGPKVVHLQYNSPMGLYSNQNVAETLQGQTQAMSGQTKPNEAQSGERDWSQSSVLRFIQNEEKRNVKKAPPTAPKPQPVQQYQPQQPQQPYYDEIGASDF